MMTRILIIEDNPTDAQMFGHLLEKEGYEVELAASAEEGLARVPTGNFDVVLTDLYLGGAKSDGGRDLVVQLRAAHPHLPVILMTGGHTAEIAIDVIKQGAFDYFCKPVSIFDESFRADLVEMIDQAATSKQLMAGVKLPDETATAGQSTPTATGPTSLSSWSIAPPSRNTSWRVSCLVTSQVPSRAQKSGGLAASSKRTAGPFSSTRSETWI